MIRLFGHHIALTTLVEIVADLLLCFIAFPLAIAVRSLPGNPSSQLQYDIGGALLVGAGFSLMMALLCIALGVYRSQVDDGRGGAFGRTLLAIAIGLPAAWAMVGALPDSDPVREAFAFAFFFAACGLFAMRWLRIAVQHLGIGSRRVLIIGAGEDARDVAAKLERLEGRSSVVGFIPSALDADDAWGPKVLPRDADLCEVVRRLKVDEVVVAVREQRGNGVPLQALLACRVMGVPVLDLAAFYERTHREVPVDRLKSSWLIYGHGFAQDGVRRLTKRVSDIAAAALLIALTWPLMVLAAIVIRLESRGPVIFRQERVGLAGRSFRCLKFRSMRVDAEQDGVARWATVGDARVTRVGRFIRKTRIDELPQLLNVLRGEMSLVGPRPERPTFVGELKEQIPYYDIRHTVKPGLTGWAQVRYSYGASIEDSRRKLQFDLYYVKNHSLFLDLLILFETIRVIVFREGAR